MQFDLCIATNILCFNHENLVLIVYPECILQGMNFAIFFLAFKNSLLTGQNIQRLTIFVFFNLKSNNNNCS